jgi:hypothetical protein
MTFEEANLSLLLAAEERVGFVVRERARIARQIEDAMAGQSAAALSRE